MLKPFSFLLCTFFITTTTRCTSHSQPVQATSRAQVEQFAWQITQDAKTRTLAQMTGTLTMTYKTVPVKLVFYLTAHALGSFKLELETEEGIAQMLISYTAQDLKNNIKEQLVVIDWTKKNYVKTDNAGSVLASLGIPNISAQTLARLFLTRLACESELTVADNYQVQDLNCLHGAFTATYQIITNNLTKPLFFLKKFYLVDAGNKNNLHHNKDTQIFAEVDFWSHNQVGFARRIEIKTQTADFVFKIKELTQDIQYSRDLFTIDQIPSGFSEKTLN